MIAQTVLGSLAGWGEKLEAVVSLIAIGVLLLILNWFYHRVYWQENLHDLHKKKKRILAGASVGLFSAQVLGLVALGFSSVYREGFETVLFLQALTLEAGAVTVLQGVLVGFAGVVGVFFLVIALERRLPHKKMLIATGVLITWVLVILVGQTVQTMQKVGWLPVSPIEGLQLPYWSGVWLGLYPTWEGLDRPGVGGRLRRSAATSAPKRCAAGEGPASSRRRSGRPQTRTRCSSWTNAIAPTIASSFGSSGSAPRRGDGAPARSASPRRAEPPSVSPASRSRPRRGTFPPSPARASRPSRPAPS